MVQLPFPSDPMSRKITLLRTRFLSPAIFHPKSQPPTLDMMPVSHTNTHTLILINIWTLNRNILKTIFVDRRVELFEWMAQFIFIIQFHCLWYMLYQTHTHVVHTYMRWIWLVLHSTQFNDSTQLHHDSISQMRAWLMISNWKNIPSIYISYTYI